MDEVTLSRFIRRAETRPVDTDDMEVFHESTKYYPSVMYRNGQLVSAYLNSDRGALETAFNFKSYFPFREFELPAPLPLSMPLADALSRRRTCRRFSGQAVSLEQLSTLLQLSCGVTGMAARKGQAGRTFAYRCTPSAGGLSLVETYALALNVDGLQAGLSHYSARKHALDLFPQALDRSAWHRAMYDDDGYLVSSAVCFLVTAVLPRATVKYRSRGYRFALLEAGSVLMNASLAAEALGLGSVIVGGFYDDEVHGLLEIDGIEEVCLGLLFVGVPAGAEGQAR